VFVYPKINHDAIPEFAVNLVHITDNAQDFTGTEELETFADVLCGINEECYNAFHTDSYISCDFE